jgi:hypothetical protein
VNEQDTNDRLSHVAHGDETTIIDWRPMSGRPDWLFGTDATGVERGLTWAASIVGIVLAIACWWFFSRDEWSWWQVALVCVIAFDVVGGAVANASNSIKRTYGTQSIAAPTRTSRLVRSPIVFAAAHVHPIVLSLVLPGLGLGWGIGWYVSMLVAVVVVTTCPLYVQRPVAMICFVTLLGVSVFAGTPLAIAWFLPMFLAKLVLAHSVREEPYRPAVRRPR